MDTNNQNEERINKNSLINENLIKCSYCRQQFIMQEEYLCHRQTFHQWQCVHCSKFILGNLHNFNEHIRIHSGDRPFQCHICTKKFALNSYLKKHMRVHNGEQPYECYECQRRFSQSDSLKRHLRLHTGERPFECYICEKKFTRKDHLKRHLRVHNVQQPFECHICKKRFFNMFALNKHMKNYVRNFSTVTQQQQQQHQQ